MFYKWALSVKKKWKFIGDSKKKYENVLNLSPV